MKLWRLTYVLNSVRNEIGWRNKRRWIRTILVKLQSVTQRNNRLIKFHSRGCHFEVKGLKGTGESAQEQEESWVCLADQQRNPSTPGNVKHENNISTNLWFVASGLSIASIPVSGYTVHGNWENGWKDERVGEWSYMREKPIGRIPTRGYFLNPSLRVFALPRTKFSTTDQLCQCLESTPNSLRTFRVKKVLRK